jgi:hypothetical protein
VLAAQVVAEVAVRAALDLHANHDGHGLAEHLREVEVRLGELAPEDEYPEADTGGARGEQEYGVWRSEGLRGEVLAVLAHDAVPKQAQ